MTPPADYQPRIADDELKKRLRSAGGVVIEGPKACGKTETARQQARSEVLLDVDDAARAMIDVDPNLILTGETPRLIDEWQIEPRIWNHIRRQIDDHRSAGQFILTGSAIPADDITRHSGAGRLSRLRMRPMSLYESGASSGDISLRGLLDGDGQSSADPGLDLTDLIEMTCRGGWPALREMNTGEAQRAVNDYLEEICRTDISKVDGRERDPAKVRSLLKSLARNTATYATLATLARGFEHGDPTVSEQTASAYMRSLAKLMVIEEQPAWTPHLRSRADLRNSPKQHFVDPSLAVAALATNPERLALDLNFFGFLFESMVIRDLRIYSQAIEGKVLQYRDNKGVEVDAIIELADGRWGAFEVKLGTGRIDEAASSLQRFVNKVDTDRVGKPALLGVVVGNGYGYTRKDGVAVLPIGALGP